MRRRDSWEASEAGFTGLGSGLNRDFCDFCDFLEAMPVDPREKVATTWGTIKRSL